MRAASIRFTPRSQGAKRVKARISQLAGTKDSSTAGRPTCFKSRRFRESPAFSKIIMRAICRSWAEMDKMEGSSKSST